MPTKLETTEDFIDHLCQQEKLRSEDLSLLLESGDDIHERILKDFARLCTLNVERKMSEFSTLYLAARSRGSNFVDDLKSKGTYVEKYSMQIFKEKLSVLENEYEDGIPPNADNLPIGNHRHALTACHLDLVNSLDLRGTTLLDDLVANHLMEESDYDSITTASARGERARTEAFLRRAQVLFCRETFINNFLPILSHYNPGVEEKLKIFMQQNKCYPESSKCYVCQVRAFVEPRLLADVLLTRGAIGINLHQDLREQTISNQEKWDRLVKEVKDHRDIIEAIRVRCLPVYQELHLADSRGFECCCHLIMIQPPLTSYDGNSDISRSDIANIADLDSVLEPADDDCSDDLMSISTTSDVDSLGDFTFVENQDLAEMNQLHNNANDAIDCCETEGFKHLNENKASRRYVDERLTRASKRFGATIKTFLTKQLNVIRHPWRRSPSESSSDGLYDYDAFIMFAESDRAFVMGDIRRVLEDRHGMRLCLHHRDFTQGKPVVENILSSLERSRKAVAVLSKAFFESLWCKYEYDMAALQGAARSKNICISVLCVELDWVPRNIALHLSRGKCLDYVSSRGDVTFWQGLINAIRD